MKLNELKSKLKEKEKDIKEFMGCNDFGLTWSIQTNKPLIDFYCGKHIREDYHYCFRCFNKLKMKQAEISALKKGISACEEILNSQESLNGNKANTSPTAPKNVEELSEVGCDRKSLSAPDNQTLIKQGNFNTSMNRKVCYEAGYRDALSQRNKEILEIIERMMNKKEDETDVQIWGEELKSKLQEGNKQ